VIYCTCINIQRKVFLHVPFVGRPCSLGGLLDNHIGVVSLLLVTVERDGQEQASMSKQRNIIPLLPNGRTCGRLNKPIQHA
jgi:hypothetical protein